MMEQKLHTIGKSCMVTIVGHASDVPAKVDTGADSSSIWATNLTVDHDAVLHFTLFGEGSPFYTGEDIAVTTFKVAQVRSSTGHIEIRYRVSLPVRVGGKYIRATFNLSDRSHNEYPILIGRRTLSGKFLVDVSRGGALKKSLGKTGINDELRQDPRAFFEKYHSNEQ